MAVLPFPDITPDAEEWSLVYNTQVFTSTLTRATQTAELPGARWRVRLTFTNRIGRDARELGAFLTNLKGRLNRFTFTPSDAELYGAPSGTGTVSGTVNEGASSFSTTGWDPNITELFVAGDYFEVNGELKKVVTTVGSDGSGNATIEFQPPLRTALGGGNVIQYTDPEVTLRLTNDNGAGWQVSAPVIYGITIEAIEALDI